MTEKDPKNWIEELTRDGRSRDQRALDLLADWLARPNWTRDEANYILAGLDPELSMWPNDQPGGWVLLPGTARPARDDWFGFDQELRDRVERLQGAGLTTMKPSDAIAHAIKRGIDPPWLDVARQDPDCAHLLPTDLLKTAMAPEGTARSWKPKSVSEFSAAGGRAKRDLDPNRLTFFPIVIELLKQGMTGAEIIRKLADDHKEPPADSTVYDWIRQIRRENSR